MKLKLSLWLGLASCFGLWAYSVALIPNCNYAIPAYGGTPCNLLPTNPPPAAKWKHTCVYNFCDENDNCSSEPSIWQKKIRYRKVYEDGANPVQYWQGGLAFPDADSGCCYCND
jgi:hypothetical protein